MANKFTKLNFHSLKLNETLLVKCEHFIWHFERICFRIFAEITLMDTFQRSIELNGESFFIKAGLIDYLKRDVGLVLT